MKPQPIALASLLVLAACAAGPSDKKLELAEIEARHQAEKAGLEQAQDAFRRRWKAPFDLEFPGEGTIEIGECALQGYEDHVELRLLYTYVNTTGRPIDGVRIVFELVDPESGQVRAEETLLRFPPLIPFLPDSSFTTAVNIPTRGLHLRPGWEWRIRPQVRIRGER
jgi:hypothetical protein